MSSWGGRSMIPYRGESTDRPDESFKSAINQLDHILNLND